MIQYMTLSGHGLHEQVLRKPRNRHGLTVHTKVDADL